MAAPASWPAARAASLSASSLAPNTSTARPIASRASTIRPRKNRIIARPRIALINAGRSPRACGIQRVDRLERLRQLARTTLTVASQNIT